MPARRANIDRGCRDTEPFRDLAQLPHSWLPAELRWSHPRTVEAGHLIRVAGLVCARCAVT